MCGRFVMTIDPAVLAEKIQAINEAVQVSGEAAWGPNYNVAPTATIVTVVRRHDEPEDEPTRRVRLMRWGMVPPWVKAGPDGAPEARGPQLINARADRVTTSPAFRSSAKSRRCLVPMDGYYEWRATPESGKTRKTPFYLYREDGEPLFTAGLWSVWKPQGAAGDVQPLRSCTIITTDAVGELAEIHDRMPLLVAERAWDRWLDPDAPPDPGLLTGPPDVRGIRMREISTLVNNVRNNGPELIEPVERQSEQSTLF
ncbi:SOS response-associated peptidase [Mycobacterium sp.]|uniref:SOS response-associated peptidase n=1 Tax=Mycobacterium sp. TaxID=1785 RepID=UPI00128475D6|nr:SOS response-associated peptidase [Mycobacterium sp.]KAA8959504.1 MAG: SOS response-associated peptidase [Mycobacterium sp.]